MEKTKPSIEEFYQRCLSKTLYLTKCNGCQSIYGSPRTLCPKCGSGDLTWTPSKGIGKLVTWTVIHVAPPEFQEMTPYIIGIVELEEGGRLLSLIKRIEPEKLREGLKLKVNYELEETGREWPQWPRYYFEPYR